jgi:beta-hydroxylase
VSAFPDPQRFALVPALEAAFPAILAELQALTPDDFAPSPDSLTEVRDGYDETGWHWFGLFGEVDDPTLVAHRARCPATVAACAAVPGLVNAGLSLFRPGTHLYPHHGERHGVLRCHLALAVPAGDVALRAGGEIGRWQRGRCLILDATFVHVAWNRGDGDRIVLLVTFAEPSRNDSESRRS